MQKSNRILIRALAILLILVLATSCMTSGIFAKYALKKVGYSTFVFERFGVSVGMDLSDELKAIVDPDYADTPYYDSITLDLNNLNLKPGDSYLDAVKLSVSGTPSVPVRVTLDVNITFDMAEFKILEDDFPTLTSVDFDNECFLPIEFSFNAYDASGNSQASVSQFDLTRTGVAGVEMSNCYAMSQEINFGFGSNSSNSDFWLYKDFAEDAAIEFHPVTVNDEGDVVSVNEAIDVNDFAFGFSWPEYSSSAIPNFTEDEYNAICTWLVQNNDPAINITYTITVEQILS